MTMEIIFAVVTAVVTGLLGVITKNNVIPSRFIPVQNFIIGIIAALLAFYFKLFDDIVLALVVSLGMAFCAGGVYDLTKTFKKEDK